MPPVFRQLPPEKWWSGSLDISKIERKFFEKKIKELSLQLSFTFSGYITGTKDNKKYTFTRYPRKSFGPLATISTYENVLQKFSEILKTDFSIEVLSSEERFRVLMGLIEGYKTAKNISFEKNYKFHEISRTLGSDYILEVAEIYSVGPWGTYAEPAIVIEGEKSTLEEIYLLTEKFHQARICVMDLKKGISWMVETKFCQNPDTE
jgi:hypothetical protein